MWAKGHFQAFGEVAMGQRALCLKALLTKLVLCRLSWEPGMRVRSERGERAEDSPLGRGHFQQQLEGQSPSFLTHPCVLRPQRISTGTLSPRAQ